MQRLGGGCRLPFGAFAQIEDGALAIRGFISDASGSQTYRGELAGRPEEAEAIGAELADALLAQGAAELMQSPRVGL